MVSKSITLWAQADFYIYIFQDIGTDPFETQEILLLLFFSDVHLWAGGVNNLR